MNKLKHLKTLLFVLSILLYLTSKITFETFYISVLLIIPFYKLTN